MHSEPISLSMVMAISCPSGLLDLEDKGFLSQEKQPLSIGSVTGGAGNLPEAGALSSKEATS